MDLTPFTSPRSILVCGVSEGATNAGRQIVGNLLAFQYPGAIYLLGQRPGSCHGLPILTSMDEVPDGVDLAVIMTPARTVPGLLDACGRKGIRHAVVQSGGFAELGDQGASLQQEVAEVAARHGIRFVGPNCLGVLQPDHGVCTFFVPFTDAFRHGRTLLAAQSGGVGAMYLCKVACENIGLRTFVSLGNKLNVDEADILDAFAADHEYDVACIYLEDVRRGRAFFDALRRCKKPVLIQRAGRTALGQKAAFSHTAALAGDDAVLSAAIEQAGGIRVRSADDMVNTVKAFMLPPMRGRRLAIISRSGGHAVIGADCAADEGFELPDFPREFLERLGPGWSNQVIRRGNPLDLGDIFDFNTYASILDTVLGLPEVDGALMLHEYFARFEGTEARRLLPAAEEAVKRHGKPVALVLFTDDEELAGLRAVSSFPFFTSAEAAVASLATAFRYHLREDLSVSADAPGGLESAVQRVQELAATGRHEFYFEGLEVISLAGVRVPPWGIIRSAEDIPDFCDYPVAVKACSARSVHKSAVGGVVLNVHEPGHLRQTVASMVERFGPFGDGEGVLVQRMCAPASEVIVGGIRDPSFGPVVMVGLGGVAVEVMGDIALRLAPLSVPEAHKMILGLKSAPLLTGFNHRPAADIEALAHLVSVVSHLLAAAPDISELDLNPCLVYEKGHGVTVVDARLKLQPAVERVQG